MKLLTLVKRNYSFLCERKHYWVVNANHSTGKGNGERGEPPSAVRKKNPPLAPLQSLNTWKRLFRLREKKGGFYSFAEREFLSDHWGTLGRCNPSSFEVKERLNITESLPRLGLKEGLKKNQKTKKKNTGGGLAGEKRHFFSTPGSGSWRRRTYMNGCPRKGSLLRFLDRGGGKGKGGRSSTKKGFPKNSSSKEYWEGGDGSAERIERFSTREREGLEEGKILRWRRISEGEGKGTRITPAARRKRL